MEMVGSVYTIQETEEEGAVENREVYCTTKVDILDPNPSIEGYISCRTN